MKINFGKIFHYNSDNNYIRDFKVLSIFYVSSNENILYSFFKYINYFFNTKLFLMEK